MKLPNRHPQTQKHQANALQQANKKRGGCFLRLSAELLAV